MGNNKKKKNITSITPKLKKKTLKPTHYTLKNHPLIKIFRDLSSRTETAASLELTDRRAQSSPRAYTSSLIPEKTSLRGVRIQFAARPWQLARDLDDFSPARREKNGPRARLDSSNEILLRAREQKRRISGIYMRRFTSILQARNF